MTIQVHSVWDNGGATVDRYSIYFDGPGMTRTDAHGNELYYCLAMNGNPYSPSHGFCQHCEGMPGGADGVQITLDALPDDCRKLVNREMEA